MSADTSTVSSSDDTTRPPRWTGTPADLGDWGHGEPEGPLFGDPLDAADQHVADAGTGTASPGSAFAGNLVVVTGAAGPLGSAIARCLADLGAIVCLVGRDLAPLVGLRRRIASDVAAPVLLCDLADGDDVAGTADFIARLGRPVDLVIHAAGLQAESTVASSPVESLDEHYLLNVRGPYQLTQRLLPLMRPGSGGCVFFVAPESVEVGNAHHSITRAAAAAMARELGREVASAGLRVIEVETSGAPGASTDVDHEAFADGLAHMVLGAIGDPSVEVTGLKTRHRGSAVRTEQR